VSIPCCTSISITPMLALGELGVGVEGVMDSDEKPTNGT
jgi:hypothetical protein